MKYPTIFLKRFKVDWSKDLYTLLKNEQINQYLDIPLISYTAFTEWLKNIEWLEFFGEASHWVVFDEKKHLIAGSVIYLLPDTNKRVEMGTWIAPAYWGRGYNNSIKKELLHYIFQHNHVEEVLLFVQKENKRAIASIANLPYITLPHNEDYDKYWKKKEFKLGKPLLLFLIKKSDFFEYLKLNEM